MKTESAETKKKRIAPMPKPASLLEAFEKIVEKAEKSGLPNELFEASGEYTVLGPHILYASRKLKLNVVQLVLLALFIDHCDDSSIRLHDLAGFCGCRNTRMLRLSKEIDKLEERRYIRASRTKSGLTYRVPQTVLEALGHDTAYEYTPEPVFDLRSFFDFFNNLVDERDNNEITYRQLIDHTVNALAEIADKPFAKKLKSMELDEDELILGIFMMHLFVENSDDNIRFHDIEDIYDNSRIPSWIKGRLTRHTSDLFEHKIIENLNDDGMVRPDAFKVTESAKEELLGELELNTGNRSNQDIEKHDKFAAKNLIYNDSEGSQVKELTEILRNDRFADVQKRLEKAGMRKGFCCLFYGAPGTGKTETVYQIARATGRDILRVDVDKIKSCWVGESEKNIKKFFDRYRTICQNSELAPILLFNEADAVLGVRMEGASRAVDKMENSIQNIILQEMENLDGIMIATTNLTSNLDKAFERRFLYKICFNRPTQSMRSKIWQSMMPGLDEKNAMALASNFDLSGGQIENVVRRHTVNSILSGSDVIDIDAIMEVCRHEGLNQPGKKNLGFCV